MDTSVSLLERLREHGSEADWGRLDALYRPLVRGWLRRDAQLGDEADDLTQEVLTVVFQELPGFQRQRTGSFRRWLRTITLHRLRAYWRRRNSRPQPLGLGPDEGPLGQLADDHSDLARRWDEEHNQHVVRSMLELAEKEFSPSTVRAFRLVALEKADRAEVAEQLGLSLNQVYLANSRVRKWLGEELDGLLY